VLAPVVRGRKGTYDTLLADLAAQGFARAIVDGETPRAHRPSVELARYEQHTIEVVVDRLVLRSDGIERRLTDSLETALRWPTASPRSRSSPGRRATEAPDPRRSPSASTSPAPRAG
jgi:excinuclease UvrABC ATPase subunit